MCVSISSFAPPSLHPRPLWHTLSLPAGPEKCNKSAHPGPLFNQVYKRALCPDKRALFFKTKELYLTDNARHEICINKHSQICTFLSSGIQKSPISWQKSPIFRQKSSILQTTQDMKWIHIPLKSAHPGPLFHQVFKRANNLTKELCFLTTEPYFLTKEAYFVTKEPYFLTK